jgi:D-hydroxyproline dehydrogenase subunit beta
VADGAQVVVVGGGVIGAACADALAGAGASVILLEREVLAAGASGRNQGLFVTPSDPPLVPMAAESLRVYVEVADDSPLPVRLDSEPVGFLRVAERDDDLRELEEEALAAERNAGVAVDRLDGTAITRIEPAVAEGLAGGFLFHTGRRLDPTSLTVSLALRAGRRGASIREHQHVRGLLRDGEAVRGVVTAEGPVQADVVVVAAGPWTTELLRPLGLHPPITRARGWVVLLDAGATLGRRPMESAGGSWRDPPGHVTAGELVDRPPGVGIGTLIHPADDGTVSVGSSRELAIAGEPDNSAVPREILRRAIRFVPSLARARVASTWWGVRPMSPDERPLIGRLADGLVVAGGHGSEGVLLAGGTAALVRAIVLRDELPFDPTAFEPTRFDGA